MNKYINTNSLNNSFLIILCFTILLFILEYLSSVTTVIFSHVLDAVGYYYFSKVPLLTTDFWLGMRPVGYPLFIKLLQSNPNLVAAAQSLLYVVSWSFFAIYLYIRSNNKLFGLLSGIAILLIAIHPSISVWTHNILTESLTFTLVIWILILLYEFIVSKNKLYMYSLLLILFLYSTIRDVNAYYVITFILVFSILYFYKNINKYNFIIANIIILTSFAISDYTANHSRDTVSDKSLTFQSNGKTIAHRWVFPFMNLAGRRFLTNKELFDYMKKEGMPINDALLKQKNAWGGMGWYDNSELKEFRDWVAKSAKSTYTKFLITHPKYTFGKIYENRYKIFHYNQKESKTYYLRGYKLDNIFTYSSISNKDFYRYLFYTVLIVILLSIFLRKNIFNERTLPIVALLLPIVLLTVVTYHGDAVDIFRHTVIIPFLLKVTIFMLIYVFGNELFRNNKTEGISSDE